MVKTCLKSVFINFVVLNDDWPVLVVKVEVVHISTDSEYLVMVADRKKYYCHQIENTAILIGIFIFDLGPF